MSRVPRLVLHAWWDFCDWGKSVLRLYILVIRQTQEVQVIAMKKECLKSHSEYRL